MVFCNNMYIAVNTPLGMGHNPYFNRWFSAMKHKISNTFSAYGHNPYFNRWFSAITKLTHKKGDIYSHNPYFNRWFSAIKIRIPYLLN